MTRPTIVKPTPAPDEGLRDRFARAFEQLGCSVQKWRHSAATVRCHDEKFEVSLSTLDKQVAGGVEAIEPKELPFVLSRLIGLPLPEALLRDFDRIRERLRPRLFNRAVLTGPKRAMCRRETFGGLIRAIGLGDPSSPVLITTTVLDAWPVDFEEAFLLACENLARSLGPDDLHAVEDAPGVLALVHPDQPCAPACFVLEQIVPGLDPEHGIVFSVPDEEAMLLTPIEPGGGAESLANLVQTTFEIAAESESPLSEQVFWKRASETILLPMTCIDEGESRRVHVEASGVMEELLRILGEIE